MQNSNYKFDYQTLEDLKEDIKKLDLELPIKEELELFNNEISLNYDTIINNRLAVHPMEGTDANKDGSPADLTKRRYKRFARGGAGLLWLEATAINKQGRANEHQFFINCKNIASFSKLVNMLRETAKEQYGENFDPYLVLQLTHAGRFGNNKTILFHEDKMNQISGVEKDLPVISDQELALLEDDYLDAARLAQKAGFDAVDIKACHRYLLSEMLAAHTRSGKYGGSYKNRTRFIKNVVKKIKENIDINLAIRLNMFDSIPYPYGWGTDKDNNMDLSEPRQLVRELVELGMNIFNVTASTPYMKPHINRPYNNPGVNGYRSPEHPLIGINRLVYLARVIKEEIKDNGLVVGTGFSWLRQFAPYIASGMLDKGWADIIGFGREAFAYPDFARDILYNKGFKKNKICLTCGKCTDLKAAREVTGCVVRDREVYLPVYQKMINQDKYSIN